MRERRQIQKWGAEKSNENVRKRERGRKRKIVSDRPVDRQTDGHTEGIQKQRRCLDIQRQIEKKVT